MKNVLKVMMVMLSVVMLAGCNGGPSKSVAVAELTKEMKNLESIFKVQNITVTDMKPVEGTKDQYIVNYEYTVSFTTDFADIEKEANAISVFSNEFFEARASVESMKDRYGKFKKGDVKTVKGNSLFEKWEKGGWKLSGGN